MKLSAELLDVLAELGFDKSTPIQSQAIPLLLAGRDLIGQSKTGSGKTAAFALPILEKIDVENRELQALIICPTRELGTQVAREIRRLARRKQALQVLVVSGGQPLGPQADALRKGAHIVVGTPGRLVDLLKKRVLQPASIRTLVLDEADRMLDMGFEDDMKQIMSAMPDRRQTVLFSATYPDQIKSLSGNFQNKPAHVVIEDTEDARPDIEQTYYIVEPADKTTLLLRLLRRSDPDAALIFCNLKITTTDVGEALRKEGFSADFLNGDLEQRDRDEVMAKFRNGSTRLLVATDVAARGLDIAALPLVINYDLPIDSETYVHRIGRTGRAGQKGAAVSFIPAGEKPKLREIQSATGVAPVETTLPPRSEGGAPRFAAMRTLFIGGGRQDKVRPTDILGALTGEAGLAGADVGKIEIHDRFSYVAVKREAAEAAAKKLANGRIKNQKLHVKLL